MPQSSRFCDVNSNLPLFLTPPKLHPATAKKKGPVFSNIGLKSNLFIANSGPLPLLIFPKLYPVIAKKKSLVLSKVSLKLDLLTVNSGSLFLPTLPKLHLATIKKKDFDFSNVGLKSDIPNPIKTKIKQVKKAQQTICHKGLHITDSFLSNKIQINQSFSPLILRDRSLNTFDTLDNRKVTNW